MERCHSLVVVVLQDPDRLPFPDREFLICLCVVVEFYLSQGEVGWRHGRPFEERGWGEDRRQGESERGEGECRCAVVLLSLVSLQNEQQSRAVSSCTVTASLPSPFFLNCNQLYSRTFTLPFS